MHAASFTPWWIGHHLVAMNEGIELGAELRSGYWVLIIAARVRNWNYESLQVRTRIIFRRLSAKIWMWGQLMTLLRTPNYANQYW